MSEHYSVDDHADRRTLLVAAAYVVLRDRERVLLQQRQNTGYMDGRWALLAGHVDPDEAADLAAVREAHEESGVTIEPFDLRPLCVQHRLEIGGPPVEQRVDFYFEATRWTGVPRITEPEKTAAMDWFDLGTLPDPMPPHERAVLAALRGGTVPAIMVLPRVAPPE